MRIHETARFLFHRSLAALLLPALLGAGSGHAANNIAGIIYDGDTALEVEGVSVFVKDTEFSTQSAIDGAFLISDLPPGTYAVSFSKPGYTRLGVTDLQVPSESAQQMQIILYPDYGDAAELEEVTMTISQLESGSALLLANRQTAASLTDSIGSEDFARLGIGDAAEALSKVTGATVVGGSYVYIRGLGDRYGNTTLNNIVVPSPDPDVNSVPLDLFPSNTIESIDTSKTFTPDMPGDFSGGLVNIVTKTIPEETILNVGLSTTYNTQATGNDNFLTFPGGGDFMWAGYADGKFAAPAGAETASPQEKAALFNETNPYIFPTTKTALPDMGFKFSYGDSWELGNSPIGLVTAIDYDHEFEFYDDGLQERINPLRVLPVVQQLNDTRGIEATTLGGLIGTSVQPSPDDELGLTLLYNHSGEQQAQLLEGFNNEADQEYGAGSVFRTSGLNWTEKQLWLAQVNGDHTFTRFYDAVFTWRAQYGEASQDEPDQRLYQDVQTPSGQYRSNREFDNPQRLFRKVDENRRDIGSDIAFPFDVGLPDEEDTAEFKLGWNLASTRRETEQQIYTYGRFPPAENPNNSILLPTNTLNGPVDNFFDGKRSIWAGYAMLDVPVSEKVRLTFGVRYEDTDIEVDARLGATPVQSSLLDRNVLPAASLLWQVNDEMNVRAAFSQTIARPTFRELSPIQTIDFFGGELTEGNPDLGLTKIRNYDLRWEWFPEEAEVVAVSVFYKQFKDPIEATVVNSGGAQFVNSWQNFPSAELYGIEFEYDKNLAFLDDALDEVTLGFNLAYIKSEVDPIPGIGVQEKRPLEGQSEYVVNADITYAPESIGMSFTLAYNYFSRRLFQVSQGTIPDIYEEPVSTLDFFINKTFGDDDQWSVTLSFKNLLNPEIQRTFNGTDFVYSSYTKGVDIGISGSYSFY